MDRTESRRKRRLGWSAEGLEPRKLLSASPLGRRAAAQVALPGDLGVPTKHEAARRTFTANFVGPYTVGPGRTTGQALVVSAIGGGTSNRFLHGDVQLATFTPVDPAQPVTGTAALYDKNASNTGSILVLDLTGERPANPASPPTKFTWTVDSSSGGAFGGSNGQGTLEIRYARGGKVPARATQAGRAFIIFRGQLNTNGVQDILRLG
ncbi:hypothetical protein EP7_002367 [Isosphaeraceae bacterium EP7]